MQDVFLFSYGTLRQAEVQLALFGREVVGTPDAMLGWRQRMIEITDPDVIANALMGTLLLQVMSGPVSGDRAVGQYVALVDALLDGLV